MENQIERHIRKKDLLLLGILLLVFLVLFAVIRISGGHNGGNAVITVAGETYGTYPLAEDRTVEIEIDGKVTNTLVIRDGQADMIQADCPDQLCVHQHAISRGNENIVCLPNKVVVTVTGEEAGDDEDEVDVIVK